MEVKVQCYQDQEIRLIIFSKRVTEIVIRGTKLSYLFLMIQRGLARFDPSWIHRFGKKWGRRGGKEVEKRLDNLIKNRYISSNFKGKHYFSP